MILLNYEVTFKLLGNDAFFMCYILFVEGNKLSVPTIETLMQNGKGPTHGEVAMIG